MFGAKLTKIIVHLLANSNEATDCALYRVQVVFEIGEECRCQSEARERERVRASEKQKVKGRSRSNSRVEGRYIVLSCPLLLLLCQLLVWL